MADYKELFKNIEQQIVSLAENTVGKYKEEAIAEAKQLLANMKTDLIRWTDLLAEKQIKVNEFEWLVNSDKELVKMKGLEKAGLAATEATAFGAKVIALVINTVKTAVSGGDNSGSV